MIELCILAPGRSLNVFFGKSILHQLGHIAAVFSSDEEGVLTAQEIPSMQCGQTQKPGFGFTVSEAADCRDSFIWRHGILAHRERIAAVISRSSSTRLSFDAEPSAAYILNPAWAFA